MNSDNTPDAPIRFGYKCAWWAFKSNDPYTVAVALNDREPAIPSNWRYGMEKAYRGGVFITPPIKSWVLAVTSNAPRVNEVAPMLERLSRQLGEVQYFATHRVVEAHCWARATNGTVLRAYEWVGEAGETTLNIGERTPDEIELELGFQNPFEVFPDPGEDADFDDDPLVLPDEELVMEIAGRWSIDPIQLEQIQLPKSLGLLIPGWLRPSSK